MNTKVIFTGQSGLGKKGLIDQVRQVAETKGRQVLSFSVGDMMYALRSGISPGRILELPLAEIESLRDKVFTAIQREASNHPNHDVFVDTHSTFRWRDGVYLAFAPAEIMDYHPDVCITILADVDEVKARLKDSDFPLKNLTLRDIMVWREEELLGSELMAELVPGCKYYVVPRNLNPDSLARLIFDPTATSCYLSFPITGNLPKEVKSQIAEFRNAFQRLGNLVVFDPYSCTDEPKLIHDMKEALKKNPRARTLPVIPLGKKIYLEIDQIRDIEPYVGGQIRAFDLRLVAQTKATIALFPEHDGKSFQAAGVITEINYAKPKGCDVYLVWPASDKPTDMIVYDRKFDSTEEAIAYFRNRKGAW